MLKHNLLLFFRSIKKYKSTFLINIIGLSTALTCVLLILLWVNDELKVDQFHEKSENIYQVITNFEWQNKIITMENSPLLLAEAISQELPEVKLATSTNADFATPEGILSIGENSQVAKGIFADSNFLNVFSFDLLLGNKQQVLKGKNNVILSESLARELFKSPDDAVGKILKYDYKWEDSFEKETLVVAGVFRDTPLHSTMQFEIIMHSDLLIKADRWAGDWSGGYGNTFLVLEEGTDIEAFNNKIAKYLSTKIKDREAFTLFVQKFSDRYLKEPYENGAQVGGRIVYTRVFSFIAFFILIIACINFMNLSTAQASRRMKEIGVKKALGAKRKHVIVQFLGESIFLTTLSLIIASLIALIAIPYFNQITEKQIQFQLDFKLVLSLVVLILITGLLAGSYPAFYLSRFKPIVVLKGKLSSITGELWIRKGLVIFQFTLSIIFISGVLIVSEQMDYVMQKNLGYERDNVITFQLKSGNKDRKTFLEELKRISGVANVSFMNGSLLDGTDSQGAYSWRGENSDKDITFQAPKIGYDLIETLGIEVLHGRSFSEELKDDYTKIILNESALALMELENPVGTIIDQGDEKREIIGVVKDFQYGSLHKNVEPLILRFRNFGNDIFLKIKAGSEKTTIAQVENLYKSFQPDSLFEFSFLNKEYQKLYSAENRVAELSNYFAFMALLISCLGLFGLVVFTAEYRRKEISIRKTLGQGKKQITLLLSSEFIKLVSIAIVIGLPIAFLLSKNWLSSFAYRIDLHLWYFLLAGVIALIVALATVSVQAVRAASKSPIVALREE